MTKNPQKSIWGTIIKGVKAATIYLLGIQVPKINPNPENALYSNIIIAQNKTGFHGYTILNPIDQ